MPWTGGVFNRANGPTGWQDDAAASIGIEADRHDTQDNDFRNGINNTLTKDGTNTPTANLNFGGFKITSLGNGTATGDAINYTQITNGAPLGVDYVNSRVGIGTAAPTYIADVSRNANDADSRVRISNTSNGAAAQSGFQIANDTGTGSLLMNSSGNSTGGGANSLNIVQSGNAPVHVWTNGTIKQTILGANGFVGFNETSPGVLVDVVRSANDTLTAVRTRNANTGSSAYSSYILGNNTNASGASIRLNSSANTTLGLTLSTNGTVRTTILGSGFIGINQTTPDAQLEVRGTSTTKATISARSDIAGDVSNAAVVITKFDNNSTSSQLFARFFINNVSTGSGQINANGASQVAFGSFSDERLKQNITDLPSQTNALMALRPVEFDYKDGSGHQIGFIAQEVQSIYPDLVGQDSSGFYTLTGMGKNEARLVKGFQELAQKILDLEARVAALEA